MKIGCHVSIAGGIANAPERAKNLGCEVFQSFTRSPQGGPAPKITPEVIGEFKANMKKFGQAGFYIHTPYYINFASANKSIRDASARIVREELERGSLLGAKYVMTHLGSAKDLSRQAGLKAVAQGIAKVLREYKGQTILLLEISAGAGNVIGDTFEELAYILKGVKGKAHICLDSAHMFASGYDLASDAGFKKTIAEIKKTVGLSNIKLIHANDSKVPLGARKDRHDHIGLGKMGQGAFGRLMKAFPKADLICETEHDLVEQDIARLKKLRDN